jgi:hypothetical protein
MAKIGTSQNGWPVYDTTAPYVRFTVEGRGFWAANADVAIVMKDYITWYHKNIESINLKVRESPGYDDWSYNVRPVRGQTTGYSNHGSATAIDINATLHPRGVHGTYSTAQRNKIKAKIATYGGVLRHGEFYTKTVDGMHVEINTSNKTTVAKLAAKILAPAKAPVKPKPKPATPKPKPVEVDDMDAKELLNSKVTLGATAAKVLGKKADGKDNVVSLESVLLWPPSGERVRQEQTAQFTALTKQVAGLAASLGALNAAVAGIARGSSAEVQKAFADGIASLKTELANIDVTVSLGDTDNQ